MKRLLLVVDYQKDFVDGALGFPGAEALDGPIAAKIAACRAAGDDVAFTLDYYQEHPFIEFDIVYGDAKYEVFGAFTIDVVNDTSFIYNQYIDMDEDAYNRYVDQVISRSDVDSGIRPAYGEQLLTLSTCEYSSANGRYVVVARRVSD